MLKKSVAKWIMLFYISDPLVQRAFENTKEFLKLCVYVIAAKTSMDTVLQSVKVYSTLHIDVRNLEPYMKMKHHLYVMNISGD